PAAAHKLDVFSTRIYRIAQREPPEYGIATALSMGVLLFMLPAIVFQQWYSARRSFATLGGRFTRRVTRLRRWRWPLFGVVLSMVLLMTVLPIALVTMGTFMSLFGYFNVAQVWTLRNWQAAMTNATMVKATLNTLIIASG